MQVYEQFGLIRALQDTASASSPVTDSAAVACAWGCGQRLPNGVINTDANGVLLKPLFSYAKEAGKATGLVTTQTQTAAIQATMDDPETTYLSSAMTKIVAKELLKRFKLAISQMNIFVWDIGINKQLFIKVGC